jgi:serine/threonine protein kinase
VGKPEDEPVEPTLSAEGSAPDRPAAVVKRGRCANVLCDGEVVAGRYRVIQLLARGGMGEVYEAEDQELRDPIALKIIRPEIANDERTIRRFRREVQLARRVTHPNVCRCYDVGHHRTDGKPQVTFITMELLKGQTLTERLTQGRLAPAEALPLVRQMAAALDAAHRAGIVHRDFKSDNVVLVPSGDPAQPVRVVVTDFGVARALVGPARRSSSLTAAGMKVGTPAYMAPEQVEGGEPTPRTDLYALGVVLYEMVTGKLPFRGETRAQTAMKRLSEPPEPPRVHCPDLDPVWERVILRCLERDTAARFASAPDVVRALDGEEAPAHAPTTGWRGILLAVSLALAVSVATALILRRLL